jgi:hypothetical protein
LFFNLIPKHADEIILSWHKLKNPVTVQIGVVHVQLFYGHLFAYPHGCEISNVPNIASVALMADLLKGVIVQHDSATPYRAHCFASATAVVALGMS